MDSQRFSPRGQKKKSSGRDGMLALMFVALIAIIIIVLIVFGIRAIADNSKSDNTTSSTTGGQVITVSTTEATTVSTVTTAATEATTTATESTTGDSEIVVPTGYTSTQISSNDIYTGNLIVVDDTHVYRSGYSVTDSEKIVSLYNKSGFHVSYWLRNSKIGVQYGIIENINSLLTMFRIQFPDVFDYGNRPLIYAGAPLAGSTAVMDYTNENMSGLGFDLRIYTAAGKVRKLSYDEYTWLSAHCADYGFIVSDSSDPYHFRYVGTVHAKYISDNALTLSEYVELVKGYTAESPLKIVSSGLIYSVYYVKATGAVTDVTVPYANEYTVSGNNSDGFIITVRG